MNQADVEVNKFGNVGDLERWASVALGSFLVWRGLKKPSFVGLSGAVVGGGLLWRGTTGHCSLYQSLGVSTAEYKSGQEISDEAPQVEAAQTIGKGAEELYELWRSPEGLRQIMAHFADVTPLAGPKLTHWKVKSPAPLTVEWDSELTVEQPGQELGWSSKPGTSLPNEGSVYFRPALAGRGTEVRVRFRFEPPLGTPGLLVSKALGFVPKTIAEQSLRRFKSLAETGEIPSLASNPSGRGESDSF